MHRTLGAIDIEGHSLGGRSHRLVLNQFLIEASESLTVPLLGEHLRFEPVERRRERNARVPALTRGQHPKRRVLGQPFSLVRVLVAGQAAIDRLTKEIRKSKLAILSSAGIDEVSFDEGAQAEAFVQLAREQEASI